ncbi:hypothetical protein O6H91_08G022000 [Diphasiastrum complanatum]|uniref:Uncharacterized protein n=1 Tax=Diphasiastrum complanatum TaxID=34168 RepID=A0ACC2CWJ4_DIPCM|nr:hypothetical protein O6H91_08G022000 [Diphasiastrum complanatum]
MADSTSLCETDINTLASSLAAEIESNTCPICFELMASPHHSPVILSPCGHTFCAKCLALQTTFNHQKTCPYCRQKISSQAFNLSLKKLIDNFVALQKKALLETDSRADIKQKKCIAYMTAGVTTQYVHEKLLQAKIRIAVLQKELHETAEIQNRVDTDLRSARQKRIELERQEQYVKDKLHEVKLEHKMIASKLQKNEAKQFSLQKLQEETQNKTALVKASITTLEKECEKFRLLISERNEQDPDF